jgi:probable F420-dependent oxidoreductase
MSGLRPMCVIFGVMTPKITHMRMRIGVSLPQFGTDVVAAEVAGFARDAEALGYEAFWVGDRLLAPVDPSVYYPGGGTPQQPYPPKFRASLDPLVLLTAAAATTSTARLGTSTLNATWYNPALLARTLSGLDEVSGGRLDAGFGIGWSPEEYAAAGVPFEGRGARLDEVLDVLAAWWGPSPAEHDGERYTLPANHLDRRPVQAGGPPVLLGGFGPAALRRVGRRAAGWVGVGGLSPEAHRGLWDIARGAAEQAGRDPDALRCELRYNPPEGTTPEQCARLLDEADSLDADGAFLDLVSVAATVPATLEFAGEVLAARRGG